MSSAPHGASQTSSTLQWWLICLAPSAVTAFIYATVPLSRPLPPVVMTLTAGTVVLVQFVLLAFAGGFTYRVNAEGISVALGLLQLPLKRLPWSSIQKVEVVPEVSPLAHFRGYGWRINSRTQQTGYVIASGSALKVTADGWSYVMVMPNPAELAAAAERWLARRASHPIA